MALQATRLAIAPANLDDHPIAIRDGADVVPAALASQFGVEGLHPTERGIRREDTLRGLPRVVDRVGRD